MKKWRSRVTTDGLDRAPHRAFMRAMGLDDAALGKPMIGVVSMKGEQTPCNMTHDFQVDAAKAGIAEAGGTPREFTTISVSDGISMNHEGMKFSLLSRELIADSIEAVVHGLAYDALIGFGGCDKTLPGVMMGMIRCTVDLHLRRQRAARTVRGKDPHRAGLLRSGRRLHDRRNRSGDA
jgi:dihydroxy-acid dehydratase